MNNREIFFKKSERPRIQLGTECSDTQLYNNMFVFIKKNKKLKKAIEDISRDDASLIALKESIIQGDFSDEIQENSNAANYLLRLILDGDVTYQVGMNAYFSLLAIQGVSFLKNGKARVAKVVNAENEISKFTEFYLNNLSNICDNFHLNNIEDELLNYILNDLSPSEKHFIWLEYDMPESYDYSELYANELLAETLAYNMPFFSRFESKSTNKISLFIPSLSILSFMLSKAYNNPVKMQFFFGICGADSLLTLHANDVHPVSIIHPLISSNLLNVHGFECGPFLTALHDIGHAFWGSMLSKGHRDIIFDALIPAVNHIIQNAEGCDIPLEILYRPYNKLMDFDLSPIKHYINRSLRFEVYVASALSILPQSVLGENLFNSVGIISSNMKKDNVITLPQLLKFNVDLAGFMSKHTPEAGIQKVFSSNTSSAFTMFAQQDNDVSSVPDPSIKFYK